ncbi:hypothetical protein RND81_08G088000 [Saponaria officinalis]|uniref:Uncharacterized protein n=1 Tax=Saponaria officinalis TaxID=3572 RepID=A0AAW1J6G7_SAPOF
MATTLHPSFSSSSSSSSAASPSFSVTIPSQRSPWHSPVPYLFGGLAAMLGLIAFALLILACSYWKLSSENDEQQSEQDDLEKGEGGNKLKNPCVYEEKIVVIMAGDDMPSFLANPAQILFLKPTTTTTTINQHDVVVASSVAKNEETNSTTTTTTVVDDDDDDKPKEDENVLQHQH